MSITFRVTSDTPHAPIAPAQVSVRQLVTFRNFARDHAILIDDLADDDDITRSFSFELSVCRFALAQLAPLFAYDLAVIAVIDEAQFCQRQVRFFKDDASGELMMKVSPTMEGSINLDLAMGSAYVVLEALDLPTNNQGTLPIAQLRERLSEPDIRARLHSRNVRQYLPKLDRLAAIVAHEQDPHLVWD